MTRNTLSTGGPGDMLPARRDMSAHQAVYYVCWFAQQVVVAFVAVSMWRNRLASEAPVFFTYLLFSLAKFIVRFSVYHLIGGTSPEYYFVYWTFALIDAVFALAVIHEVYILVLERFEALKLFASVLFRWSTAVLVLVGAVAAASAPGSDLSRITEGILALDRSATIVQIGLIVLLFLLTSALSLPWQRHLFGIAAGMAVIISVEAVALAITSRYGLMFASTYNWVKSIACLCGVSTWAVYLVKSEASPVLLGCREDFALSEWNAVLLKFLYK